MIKIPTQNAAGLLAAIKKAIDNGSITTWSYDKDGDFTHEPPQWKGKAWLKPFVQADALAFGIVGQKDTKMSKEYYAVYHGRFIEMLLAHFDTSFPAATATALPGSCDSI